MIIIFVQNLVLLSCSMRFHRKTYAVSMLEIFKLVNSTPLLFPPICLLFFTGKFIFINIKFIEFYKTCYAKESTELSLDNIL